MKNRMRKIRLTACAVTAAFALAACGGSDDKETSGAAAQTGSQYASEAADNTGDDGTADAALMEKYASVQDFLDAPSVKEELTDPVRSALPEDSGMSMEILGEDNKLIYSIIVEDSSLAKQMTKHPEEMDSGFDAMASGLESVASGLSDAVDVTDPVVVLRYVTADGTEIASREYTAQ